MTQLEFELNDRDIEDHEIVIDVNRIETEKVIVSVEDKEITYTGEQLRSHWIYEQFDILGDAIVGFTGKADVKLDKMVDIEDCKAKSGIYSVKMLHFIVEHFGSTLEEVVLRQRLFICNIKDYLNELHEKGTVIRKGDDLYYNNAKLSVSIATVSRVSGLIHVGINIDSRGAPVKAAGLLSEMNLGNINNLAINLMKGYTKEYQQIKKSVYKVKSVT